MTFYDIQQPLTVHSSGRKQTRQQFQSFKSSFRDNSLSSKTGPCSLIRGKDVLVLTDNQNLDMTAKQLGYKMSWRKFSSLLDNVCQTVSKHSILAQRPDDNNRIDYLTDRDWIPHATLFRTVHTQHGRKRKGNADMLMSFWGGLLVSRSQADVVVIGSGDGDLVQEMAIGIRSLPTPRTIITTGFKSSTANRLYASNSDLIDGNIFIGSDCLHSISELRPAAKAA